ncbi:MAG: lactate dehydrogenase [Clostridiaceae bacterium]|nr:lactate dehydrogenase [Clostridiaceae bacterium]
MFYYRYLDKLFFSTRTYDGFEEVQEETAQKHEGKIYFLHSLNPENSRKYFCVNHPSLLFVKEENIDLLHIEEDHQAIVPQWIVDKIKIRKVMSINTSYPNWKDALDYSPPKKWRLNIVGLGDVGSTLLIGLRLLGGENISSIGIYDRTPNKLDRWKYEINQVYCPGNYSFPEVDIIHEEQLFDCDMFIFCIAARVPAVGEKVQDVRMIQFEENSKIISDFAQRARTSNFKGVFAVVSDPVDLLCKVVLNASNTNENGDYDFKGLSPEQIRGYGLGVMHARAVYYSKENPKTLHYPKEGRAFGPHGADLVIADSIEDYNDSLSLYLTEKAKTANIAVRDTGFKPYIAPALSSGSLSILETIRGNWHYSATYLGGVYMGANNRMTENGTEIEMLSLPSLLRDRLKTTYDKLRSIV